MLGRIRYGTRTAKYPLAPCLSARRLPSLRAASFRPHLWVPLYKGDQGPENMYTDFSLPKASYCLHSGLGPQTSKLGKVPGEQRNRNLQTAANARPPHSWGKTIKQHCDTMNIRPRLLFTKQKETLLLTILEVDGSVLQEYHPLGKGLSSTSMIAEKGVYT